MARRAPQHLILASRSPQRRAILEQLGIDFRVEVPEVEEVLSGADPRAVVVENALRKCRAVGGELVLAVDTEVTLHGEVFGKPGDREQAEAMLGRLAGRTHEVWSGVALRRGAEELSGAAVTRVRFRPLVSADLAWYLDSEEWRERAGGYAIQGRGAALVESIEGDYNNVVGLPVAILVQLAPELLRS